MAYNRTTTLIRPRVTEKATLVANKNVYTFEVTRDSTKASIRHDIKALYNVIPVKIAIVNTPHKKVVSKGKVGQTRSPKKAYVYLKAGDTINIS